MLRVNTRPMDFLSFSRHSPDPLYLTVYARFASSVAQRLPVVRMLNSKFVVGLSIRACRSITCSLEYTREIAYSTHAEHLNHSLNQKL